MAKPTRYPSTVKCIEGWFAAAALAPQCKAYVQYLAERGYDVRSIKSYFRSVAHFVHWLTQHRVHASQINEALVNRFLE
jgi:site-specific recombinase XerD